MEKIGKLYEIKFRKIDSPRDILPGNLEESLRLY